jgi:hypothetical protein
LLTADIHGHTFEGASYLAGQSIVVDGGNIIQKYKGPGDS